MRYYYLAASLPYLTMDQPPPFDLAAFRAQCAGLLSPADAGELDALLSGDPGRGRSAFLRAWAAGETQLRNAVARHRQSRRGGDSAPRPRDHEGFAVWIERAAAEAFGREHPLAREHGLDRCRWQLAEELERRDPYGLAGILGFAARLRLSLRWAGMDAERGRERLEDQEKTVRGAWRESQGDADSRVRPQKTTEGR